MGISMLKVIVSLWNFVTLLSSLLVHRNSEEKNTKKAAELFMAILVVNTILMWI